MVSFIIFIVVLIGAISSIVYAVKLNGRMKNGKLYVGNLLSLYAKLDTTKKSDYLALLESKQLKQFESFNNAFLKNGKVKIGRLRNEPTLAAIDKLYSWLLAQVLTSYLTAYNGLSLSEQDALLAQLSGPEVVDLNSCLAMYREGVLNRDTVFDAIQKDVMVKFVTFLLEKHRRTVGQQMEASIGFAVPTDPVELFVHMVKTHQLGIELIKNKQRAADIDNSDTFVSFD